MTRINPYKKFNGIHIPEGITKIPISKLSHGAKICYGRLARYAGKNGLCFPGIKTLAKEIGVGERATDDYLRELKKIGLIESRRRGLGKSNIYYFLDHDVLKDTLTRELEDADNYVVNMHNTTDKESHNKENQNQESKIEINPNGLSPLGPDPIQESGFVTREEMERDIKEIIMAYRSKVSKSYKPHITSETSGLIEIALESFPKEYILKAINNYSFNEWHMLRTAKYGINWFFKYDYENDTFENLETAYCLQSEDDYYGYPD